MSDRKPYFCPVNKEHYFKLESGEQGCEIRPNNHRGWNENNIYQGRYLKLSNGYGNYNRVTKIITRTFVIPNEWCEMTDIGVAPWHIHAVKKIYPNATEWLVAYV